NESTYSFEVTVTDMVDPEVTCPVGSPFTFDNTPDSCGYLVPNMALDATADDNCGVVSLVHDWPDADSANTLMGAYFEVGGPYMVTWTATDAEGNTDECTIEITVLDAEDPFFTYCPVDTTVGTSEDGLGLYDCAFTIINDFFDAEADDNCAVVSLTHDFADAPLNTTLEDAVLPEGSNTITWTAEDAAGNTETCTFTITVVDDENPIINDCPADFTVFTNPSSCDVIASWSPPIDFEDNCALASFDVWGVGPDGDTLNIFNTNPGSCLNTLGYVGAFSPGLWAVTQSTGNADFVHDAFSYEVDLSPGAAGLFTDNVVGEVNVPSDYQGVVSLRVAQTSQGVASGSIVNIEVNGSTVHSNLSLIGNATNFVSFNVFPGDVITFDIVVTKTVLAANFANVVIDNFSFLCDNSQANANIGLGTSSIYYQLTDLEGNDTICQFNITLEDNDAPVANGQDVTVQVGAGQTINVPATAFDAGSTDNCGIVEYLVRENPAGPFYSVDCSNVGDTIALQLIVCDAAMNCDTADVSLIVEEIAIPVIAFCPADQVLVNDAGECGAVGNYPTPRVHDGCSADSAMALLNGLASGEMFPVGVTPVTWFHVGKNTGDTVLCQFNVVVNDNEAPVITGCPADIIQPKDAGSCSATVTWTEPTADDNCTAPGDILVIQNHFPGDEFPVGKTTVQYTFIDEAGNSDQCIFDITIEDPEVPFVLCRDYTVELDSCGELVVYANDIRVSAEADCGIALLEIEINGEGFNIDSVVLDCNYLGVNNAIFRATTKAGISNTCEATVTVIDVIAPEVVCHDDITVNISDYDDALCSVTGIPGIGFDYIDCNGLPTAAGEYYSNDSCNVETRFSIEDEDGNIINVGPFTGPVSFDPGAEVFQLGDNVVTVIVTDANGLSDQCDFTVTVVDDVPPIVECAEDITRGTSEDGVLVDCIYIVQGNELDPITVEDNCEVCSVVNDVNGDSTLAGHGFEAGTHVITWTVTDCSDNVSTCQVTLTVVDDVDPQITCADDAFRTTSQDGVTVDCFYIASGGEFDPVFTFDNCEIESVTHDYDPGLSASNTTLDGAQFPGFCETTVVTWTITDTSGRTATCVIEITVEDSEDPMFLDPTLTNTTHTCGDTVRLVNVTNNCHAELIVNRPTLDDTWDNCSDPMDMTMTEDISDASVAANVAQNHPWGGGVAPSSMELDFPVGITTLTWVVYDQVCDGNEPNTDTCVLTVVVEDTEIPVITCPSPQNIYSICADTEVPNYIGSVQVIDNCPTDTITQDPAPGTTLEDVGVALEDGATFQVTITVTQPTYNATFDDFVVTCDFTITLVDEDMWTPTAGLPQGFLSTLDTISCGGASVVITAPTATKPNPEDCSDILTAFATLTSSNDNFVDLGNGQYQLEIGTYSISWVYNGGPLNQFQLINVVPDFIPPVAVCQDITVELDTDGSASIDAETDIDNGSTDNCGISAYAIDIDAFTCADLGLNTVTLTVTDLDGNTDECEANVLVVDNIAPVAECIELIVVSLDEAGQGSITVDDVDAGSSDNCTITNRTLSRSTFDCDDLFSGDILFDTTSVEFSLIAEATVFEDNPSFNVAAPALNDPVDIVLNMEIIPISFAWTSELRIRITDNNDNVVFESTGPLPGTANNTTPVSSQLTFQGIEDVEGDWTFEVRTTFGDAIDVDFELNLITSSIAGGVPVTLTVTDQSSNSSECVTFVNVIDEIAPVALCQDVTVQLNQEGLASLGETSSLLLECADLTPTIISGVPYSESLVCFGVNNISSTNVTDWCVGLSYGNGQEALLTMVPEESGIYEFSISGQSWTSLIVFDGCPTEGANCVNGIANSLAAKSITAQLEKGVQYFILVDTWPSPVSPCSGTGTVLSVNLLDGFGDGGSDGSLLDAGSSDNCGIAEFIESQSNFSCSNVGDNVVTLTVIDASGNSSQCTSVVTVEDNIAPDFTCPESIVTCISMNVINAIPATDACGIASALYTAEGATQFAGAGYEIDEKFMPGVTTITYVVTDVNDNVTECSFTVNVDDDLLPVAVCQSNVIAPLGPDGLVTLPATLVDLGSFDLGCDIEDEEGIHITFEIFNEDNGTEEPVEFFTFNCDNIGVNNVRMTVTDNAWNSSYCETFITIQDNTPPVALCTEDPIEIYVNNGEEFVTVDDVDAGSTDNSEPCFDLDFEIQGNGFTLEDVGTQTVVLLVTDAAGNFSTCSATVEVLSGVPTAVCVADPISVFLDADGLASITPEDVDGGSFDPQDEDIVLTVNPSTFTCADAGMNIVVTLTVTDPHGNSDDCEAVVMVIDNLIPVAICQDVTIELDANGEASTSADAVDNGSFDNCGIGSLVLSQTDFDCGDVGDNPVTLTVTDNNGNSASCPAVVTVEDNISPTFVCDDELTLVLNNQGVGSIVPADVLETSVSDNCGIDEMILSQSEFDCTDLGYNHVTLTVFDVNGNFSECEFSLFVTVAGGVCPEIALIAEDVSGAEGDVLCIPVTVENFENVTGVQFSLEVVDPEVAVVLGVQELGLTDVVSNVIGNTVTVSWFESIDNAVTLNDGDAILCVEVELVGEVGDMTGAIISDDPVAIELTQGLQVVPISVFSGTVTIDAEAEMADIGGLIATEYGFGIEGVDVNVTGDVVTTLETDADGNYDASVLLGSDVTLTPYKNDNHSQGVSTMDLISIQRHLLLIQALDSPYKLIAADVSNDGVLSTFDLVILQALIIGNITEFPNNTSWRFIDADFSFTDPTNPFADVWPEYISLVDVNAASLDNDFVAIKIGDVNESIGLHGAQTRGNFNFLIEDRAYQLGDLVEVSFNANNFVGMTGYQFTLDYDNNNLEFVGFVNAGNIDNLTEANVNAIEEGIINLNWYNALSNSLNDGSEVFTLTFRAKSTINAISEHIDVSRNGLNAEAYTVNDDRMNLDIEFFTSAVAGNEFVLYQNIPNPFSGETVIGFELPSASSATIEIIDETGKLIRSINQNFEQGYNEIRVGIRELNGSGVYFYRLTTADHSAVKSMILVD
ncbi:MAG: HYR domain-containing protein, partial [Saprospirales bacterium]